MKNIEQSIINILEMEMLKISNINIDNNNINNNKTIKIMTGCGHLYCTFFLNEKNVFITSGKSGGCVFSFSEGIARLATLVLEHGGTLEEIRKQLKGIRCSSPCIMGQGKEVLSCVDGVARAIDVYIESKEEAVVA